MVSAIARIKSAERGIQEISSDVVDFGVQFAKGFVNGGIERPINGIGQLVSLGHLPALDLVQLDSKASGANKFAQSAGETAGVIFDFVLLSKLSGKLTSSVLGADSTALSTRLGNSALTGFLSGSVLTPLKPGESQWNRLANGATQAASFAAMDGISAGLGATKLGESTLFNSIVRGGISGAGGGVVHANIDSLTHGRGLATGSQMLQDGESWGAGGAIMGGLSYGFEKLTQGHNTEAAPKSETRTVSTASGDPAKISVRQLANGQSQIDSVELSNGTRMIRQGTDHKWISNPGTPELQAWQGDVRLSPEGKLQYVYRFAKAPDVVSVDVHLPDGSRVALQGTDGSITLPSSTIDATKESLADGALTSLRKLNVDIPKDRLQVAGVTTSDSVNTTYSVDLTPAEALKLRQTIATSAGAQIVPADRAITAAAPIADIKPALTENVPGEYVYDQPMPDHTSTVAFMFKGDDQRLKVLTGIRKVAPEQGKEALPGGFLDINGKSVELPSQTAAREMSEETGLKMGEPTLVRIGDALNRDTRNRVIDFQYGVFGNKSALSGLSANDDLGGLQVRDVEQLLKDPNTLAFDHHQTLLEAYRNLSRIMSSSAKPQ